MPNHLSGSFLLVTSVSVTPLFLIPQVFPFYFSEKEKHDGANKKRKDKVKCSHARVSCICGDSIRDII